MKTKWLFISLVLATTAVIWLNGRQLRKNAQYTSLEISNTIDSTLGHPGKQLLEAKCYVCHNPTTDHENRLAPPMIAVKTHYLNDDTTFEQFSEQIWNFVKAPSIEKTKMRGAVNRFGLMPYQEFKEEDIKLITEYIFYNTIEEPSWFKDHMKSKGKGRE